MSLVYLCDECQQPKPRVELWTERLRYIPTVRQSGGEVERTTGRHLCRPCIDKTAPPHKRRGVKP